MERLFSKRAIGAGRPDAVHADEQAELKNLSAVQRWLDTQSPTEESLQPLREAVGILKLSQPKRDLVQPLLSPSKWNVTQKIAGSKRPPAEVIEDLKRKVLAEARRLHSQSTCQIGLNASDSVEGSAQASDVGVVEQLMARHRKRKEDMGEVDGHRPVAKPKVARKEKQRAGCSTVSDNGEHEETAGRRPVARPLLALKENKRAVCTTASDNGEHEEAEGHRARTKAKVARRQRPQVAGMQDGPGRGVTRTGRPRARDALTRCVR